MIEELTIHNAAQVLRLHGLRYNIRGCDTWDEDTDDVDPKIQPDLRSELNSYVKTLRKPTSTRRRNEIEQLAPMLRCSHVLKAIPETAKRSLCRTATHRHATRGEKVYSRGDHADAFFVVPSAHPRHCLLTEHSVTRLCPRSFEERCQLKLRANTVVVERQ